jgi:hypothetical protein
MGLSERALAAGEQHAHRPFGDAEGGGDFAIAVAGVAEKEGRRLSLREDGESRPDTLALVGIDDSVGWFIGERSSVAGGHYLGAHIGAATGTQPVQTAVDHDSREPRANVCIAAFGYRIDTKGEQRLLCGVLSLIRVPEDASCQPDETRVVEAKYLCEASVCERIHHLFNTTGW